MKPKTNVQFLDFFHHNYRKHYEYEIQNKCSIIFFFIIIIENVLNMKPNTNVKFCIFFIIIVENRKR